MFRSRVLLALAALCAILSLAAPATAAVHAPDAHAAPGIRHLPPEQAARVAVTAAKKHHWKTFRRYTAPTNRSVIRSDLRLYFSSFHHVPRGPVTCEPPSDGYVYCTWGDFWELNLVPDGSGQGWVLSDLFLND